KQYLDNTSPDVFVFENRSPIADDALTLRQLTLAEANAELGTVQVWLHENAAARQRLEQALKDDPRSAIAAQAMGFLKFADGDDRGALANFDRALKADGTLYLSAYYRTMLQAGDRDATRAGLNHVVELNRDFAPAYIQLAAGYMREGNFESAVAPALKAQQLWPARAGYHILIGNILHTLGRDTEAVAVARYVAERWQDLHHDEAVALWQKLPAAVREGPELTKRPTPPGARITSGRIT